MPRFASAKHMWERDQMSSPGNTVIERMSTFGPTLRFKGELKAQEDIKIEGRIEGTIQHQQRVVVGAKGEVVATVNAATIDVDGRVQGDMTARKSIKVSQSAVVRGNLRAPSVSITEGANFNGGVTMESNAGQVAQGSSNPGSSR
jgi:cytoskeletal protein CcmA (bactofilin family)